MDILNSLPPETYGALDDLLTFISIYDDKERTKRFLRLLEKERVGIEQAVCVDAGCGMGLFSEALVRLGARKVYAVEANPYLFKLATQRLQQYPQVTCVQMPVQEFVPDEPVDWLLHEFFGMLLYDEDIYALDELRFKPARVVPDQAILKGGVTWMANKVDETVSAEVVRLLDGVLVAGLFDEEDCPLQFPVLSWKWSRSLREAICDISSWEGDLLYLGLEILHNNMPVCQAGLCDNWSYAWTPRMGDVFRLRYVPGERGAEVFFEWVR